MEKTCGFCGASLAGRSGRAAYCGGRCRAAASRQRRDREVRGALDAAERALNRARGGLAGSGRKGRGRAAGGGEGVDGG